MPDTRVATPFAIEVGPNLTDGRLLRGQRSRRTITDQAVQLASSYGLEGLTIGAVAKQVDVPKSSVFALFGSKEQLQLATVAAGRQIFIEEVISPAQRGTAALERLNDLGQAWFEYLGSDVFGGGCFLVAAAGEMDARPGLVRKSIAAALSEWIDFITALIGDAVREGALCSTVDVADLVFRLNAFGMAANFHRQLLDDNASVARGHRAWRTELERNQTSQGAKQCR